MKLLRSSRQWSSFLLLTGLLALCGCKSEGEAETAPETLADGDIRLNLTGMT